MSTFDPELDSAGAEKLVQGLAEAINLPVGIYVPQEHGTFYSSSTGSSEFCRLVRSTPSGFPLCQESQVRAFEHSMTERKAMLYRCHCGLTHAVAPIVVGVKAFGVVFGGQMREVEPDTYMDNARRWLRSVAAMTGGQQDALLRTFFDLPGVSRSYSDAVLERITHLADDLARVSQVASHVCIADTIEQVRELTPELIRHLKGHSPDLAKLPWDVFEHLIAEFFASWGCWKVRLVGRSDMTAADILAVEKPLSTGVALRYFVEVKRTRQKVGIEVVDRVYGAMVRERPRWGWHVAMICSVAGFKDFREEQPNELRLRGVELRGPKDILGWLRDYRLSGKGLWLPKSIALERVSQLDEKETIRG